ncbi:MAG: matrixin family metalloprotease [Acidimicrobiales bacterium]
MALSLWLEQSELAVEPGESARSSVTVANRSGAGVRVRLAVTGPAEQWVWVIPTELDVAAGSEATTGLVARVPRAAEPAAGPYPFEVVASSAGEPAVEERAAGTLEVSPFVELSLLVQPHAGDDAAPRTVTVFNRGNTAVPVALRATSDDDAVQLELQPDEVVPAPGESVTAELRLRAGRASRSGPASSSFSITAVPTGAAAGAEPVDTSGTVARPVPPPARRAVAAGVVALAVLLLIGLVVASGGGDPEPSVVASGSSSTTAAPDCIVTGHVDQRVTGLTPEDIPKLPADFSFFEVAADGCSPVRWNPCEPVHYVINPAGATPTGVADVREAFRRLGEVTGMAYVEDGMTDEVGTGGGRGREAYQPQRYGQRWAPILVSWQRSNRGTETVQVVGGGFPTLAGDVYVTGNLFLNPDAVTNPATGAKVGGGFGTETGFGAIGPEGVTWGRIILHELAHIMGLGHVRDPSQLMYPETSDHTGRPARFAAGDLAGISHLGKEAGCLNTPPLDTPTRGISGRGGQPPTTAARTSTT